MTSHEIEVLQLEKDQILVSTRDHYRVVIHGENHDSFVDLQTLEQAFAYTQSFNRQARRGGPWAEVITYPEAYERELLSYQDAFVKQRGADETAKRDKVQQVLKPE